MKVNFDLTQKWSRCFVLAFCFFIFSNYKANAQNQSIQYVSSTKEFLEHLSSNCHIVITCDTINLSYDKLKQYGLREITWNRNMYTYEVESVLMENGGLTLTGFENLIISSKNKNTQVEFVIDDGSGDILNFNRCKNISLNNLSIYHKVQNCEGNVLSTYFSDSIVLNHCQLNGSGAIGLFSVATNNIWLNHSQVYDTHIQALFFYNSKNININNCYIHDNSPINYDFLISNTLSYPIVINSTNFENNTSFKNIFSIYEDINEYKLISTIHKTTIINCSFENNSFDDELMYFLQESTIEIYDDIESKELFKIDLPFTNFLVKQFITAFKVRYYPYIPLIQSFFENTFVWKSGNKIGRLNQSNLYKFFRTDYYMLNTKYQNLSIEDYEVLNKESFRIDFKHKQGDGSFIKISWIFHLNEFNKINEIEVINE